MKKSNIKQFSIESWLVQEESAKKVIGGKVASWKGTGCTDYEDGTFCCDDVERD